MHSLEYLMPARRAVCAEARALCSLLQPFGVADMERQFRAILEQCAQHINAEYDVGGLCKAFPTRLRELIAAEGERLSH